jgi:citrate synthase
MNVDQRRFDNQPNQPTSQPEYLTAAQAIALLRIRRQTLYSYVSRGLVRSRRLGPERSHHYAREDLMRLRARRDARAGHAAVAVGALRWGEPVLESAITEITADGPRYRGRPACALAWQDARFESIAELLWTGAWVERPGWSGPIAPLSHLARAIPAGTPPLHTLLAATPLIALRDPARFGLELDAELARARVLMRLLAAAPALPDLARARAALAAPSVAASLARALGASPRAPQLAALERALVVCADHELNASAFAARVAASAGADLYACLTAALATLSGPRHGGVCDRVEALVAETATPKRAREVVAARARRGEDVPGFGHPLYPLGDPRARVLLRTARKLAPGAPRLRAIEALVAAVSLPPTLDLGLVAISSALRLPSGAAATLFAVGRAAGWIAHVLEQRREGVLLRPRARYVGASG